MTPARRPIRVTLVNDYEIIVQGLRRMLEPFSSRIEVVETQVGGVPDAPTDIALFDTFAGRRYALQRVRMMAQDRDIGKVVLYTWDAPPAFQEDIVRQGIDGVILKASMPASRSVSTSSPRARRLRPSASGSRRFWR